MNTLLTLAAFALLTVGGQKAAAQEPTVELAVIQFHTTANCEESGLSTLGILGSPFPTCIRLYGHEADDHIAKSYRFDRSLKSTMEFRTSSDCSENEGHDAVPWTCSALTGREPLLSQHIADHSFVASQVFYVTYFPTAECNPHEGVTYLPSPGLLITGVVDMCTVGLDYLGLDAQRKSRRDAFNGTHITTNIYDGYLCEGASEVKTHPIDQCVKDEFTGGYMYLSFTAATSAPVAPVPATSSPSSSPTPVLALLEGQVNLNQGAINLNKQVVGASVGVLCGFTALLIVISMTGILG